MLLQERQKWFFPKVSHQIGDLVLVNDISLPRNHWPLGRIIEVFKDKEGFVRSVNVKISKCRNANLKDFSTSVVKRPITKLTLFKSNAMLL